MNTNFHYNVVPSGKNVSTRVSFQEDLTPAAIIAQAASETGLTAEQVTAVGTSIFRQIILAGKKSQRVRRLFNLLSFTPRCGGTHPDPDFQPTPQNMNLALNASLAPAGIALFEDGVTFERNAVMGEKVPVVQRVYDGATRAPDHCTPGGAFRIGGHDFGMEPGQLEVTPGVFLTPVAGGAAVRVSSYSEWTESEIMGSWPAGLVGAQRLSIVTSYNTGGTDRNGTYGTQLTP